MHRDHYINYEKRNKNGENLSFVIFKKYQNYTVMKFLPGPLVEKLATDLGKNAICTVQK